jgi:hypothetical protein
MGEGYRSPSDIAILKNKLYLTTTSGHFLVLDVAMPQLPVKIASINPDANFRAFRVAVAGDFTYIDDAGTPQTMDMALVANGFGALYVINITNPYSPQVIATLNNVYANDIAVNSGTGMAYVSGAGAFMVIDIKNPYNPQIISNLTGLGVSPAVADQAGRVYLASSQQGLQIIDLSKNFYIVNPAPGQKIEIKNDADGNPQMPPLTVKAALKDNSVNLSNYTIKWQIKTEYNVNTVAAPQRSRKGLDPTGAGQGHDGFVITANSPGPSYTVNWGNNFGGGTIVTTAEVNVNGEILTDTYIGKIEGQTFADDANFKEDICDYLEDPSGVSNYQANILTPLGHDEVFRIIAYQESRYKHFYPSIYGIPTGAIYPRENSKGDGGFGLMQLTILSGSNPNPSYLQIWNWKENINGGVNLIKDKLRRANNYLNVHPPGDTVYGKGIIRMETYHKYGPSYKDADDEFMSYWKWKGKKGWVFSTDDWFYADTLRAIEDAVDAGNYSLTDPDMSSWKYDGE